MWPGNVLKRKLFESDGVRINTRFPGLIVFQTQIQNIDCFILIFLWCSEDRKKKLICFCVKTPFSKVKFLSSVGGALVTLRNRMWFSVVCTLIDNDMLHHMHHGHHMHCAS